MKTTLTHHEKLNQSGALSSTKCPPCPSATTDVFSPSVPPTCSGRCHGCSDNGPLLLTVREAAAYLNVEQETVYWMVNVGKIPSLRMGKKGGTIRIAKEALNKFVEC